MKNKFALLLLLFSFTFGYSQSKEISQLITERLVESNIHLRINRLALASKHYKKGEELRISSTFEFNDSGRLINISVRGSLPAIEQLVLNDLKSIKIPVDILEEMTSDYTELKFGIPILIEVGSEEEILKNMEKEKRRKQREKEKAERKRARQQRN